MFFAFRSLVRELDFATSLSKSGDEVLNFLSQRGCDEKDDWRSDRENEAGFQAEISDESGHGKSGETASDHPGHVVRAESEGDSGEHREGNEDDGISLKGIVVTSADSGTGKG